MSADRAARRMLADAQTALRQAEQALTHESATRAQAEKDVARLNEEIELLTQLLIEIEQREASTVQAAKAEVVGILSKVHGQQIAELEARIATLVGEADDWRRVRDGVERGLAEERVKTDQYRDVADKMQALCIYQSREMGLLRERVGESESQAEARLQDFNRLMGDYREIRQTTSWRATAPFRKFFRSLKRLLRTQSQSS